MVPPAALDNLSHAELKNLVRGTAANGCRTGRRNRPPQSSSPDKPRGEGRGKRGSTNSKLTIHEERIIKADAPAGSRFKSYSRFVVQDLMIRPHVGRAVRVDNTRTSLLAL